MASGLNLRNHYPLRSSRMEQYLFTFKFDTNNTSAPDGLDPANSDLVVARADVGDYTITFPADKKPLAMNYGDASILGNEAELDAKVTGYNASTGVLSISVYDEDDTSGISASADSTDKSVQVFCVFTRSRQGTP